MKSEVFRWTNTHVSATIGPGQGGTPPVHNAAATWTGTAVVAVTLLTVGACSSGSDDDASNGGEVEGVELETGTTQPPGSDGEAVRPFIEDLLARYETSLNDILADQQVAQDSSDPAVEEYRDLFEPGSDAAEQTIAGWQANADEGVTVEPSEAGTPAVASWLDGEIEVVSDDEVTFPTCDEHHYGVYDAQGEPIEDVQLVDQPGEGVAVRVDGEWRLRELEILGTETGCRTNGTEDA
jgi:hypothetical protein